MCEGKMARKSDQTAEMQVGDPKHAARATRSAGREMRSRLLDGASRLFREHGLSGTSISDIATAADAFPSQITYYFRTIERLHGEGLRAYSNQIERHGWKSLRDPDATSRRFWAVAIGVMVEGYAMGRSADELSREMLRVLGEQATTKSVGDSARLR